MNVSFVFVVPIEMFAAEGVNTRLGKWVVISTVGETVEVLVPPPLPR